MSNSVTIQIRSDGTKAKITISSKEISMEEVRAAIKKEKIVEGIQWDRLEEALEKFIGGEEETCSVVFAETEELKHLLRIGSREIVLTGATIKDLQNTLQTVYGIVNSGQIGAQTPKGIFVEEGDTFFHEQVGGEVTDVQGKKRSVTVPDGQVFMNTPSIEVHENEGWLKYVSMCNGYVGITSNGMLDIVSPITITPDKMEMHFLLAPVSLGLDALVDCFYNAADTEDEESVAKRLEKSAIPKMLSSGKTAKILVRKGTLPIQGNDARLTIKTRGMRRPMESWALYVDMKEFSTITEIAEGTVIAEKILPVYGRPGKNVHGMPIPPDPVDDVTFEPGLNVLEQKDAKSVRYVAGCNGILVMTDQGAYVSETLEIGGDIGPETGNLYFKGSIVISGDVLPGYRVECGGDLAVRGAVDDGVVVVCKKSLTVAKGIQGETTDVLVEGDAKVGFINNSRITVGGNLTVERYVYNSKVFCGGILLVEGRAVSGSERGCAIGGQIIAMKSIELDSAGSTAKRTQLICGINPEIMRAGGIAKQNNEFFSKQAALLKKETGIDLNAPGVQQKLQQLPDKEKQKALKLLAELKDVSKKQKFVQGKLQLFQNTAKCNEPKSCVIKVRKRLFPDIDIQICNAFLTVNTEEYHPVFTLKEGKVEMAR